MRPHLSVKQIAPVIGIRETHVTQAFDPALDKIAALFNAYPRQTLALIMHRAAEMAEEQIQSREAMLNGRPPLTRNGQHR